MSNFPGRGPRLTPAEAEERMRKSAENVDHIPMRRPTTAQDIANTVAFLVSDVSIDITGQTIKKVINLVHDVESELLRLIAQFGMTVKTMKDKDDTAVSPESGDINAVGEKKVEMISQSDVEALLNDFGF